VKNNYVSLALTVALTGVVVGVTKQVHASEMVRDLPEQAELMAEGIDLVAAILLAV
jgi:hypothetical protein